MYAEICALLAQFSSKSEPLKVLDLGGGLGNITKVAEEIVGASKLEIWVVFDLALEMMRAGTIFSHEHTHHNLFVQGDLKSHFPFQSDFFDVIVAANVLYLFPDTVHQQHIAREVSRVLVEGGILIGFAPLPGADNSKLAASEIRLRSLEMGHLRASVSVIWDLAKNLSFVFSQSKLREWANKKTPNDWGTLYSSATDGLLTLSYAETSSAYGEQAGIWVLKHGQ